MVFKKLFKIKEHNKLGILMWQVGGLLFPVPKHST
jgi:hypothetical protein